MSLRSQYFARRRAFGTDQLQTTSASTSAAAARWRQRGTERQATKSQSGKRKASVVWRTEPPMASTTECASSQPNERFFTLSQPVSPAAVANAPSAAYVSATSAKYDVSRLVA